MSCATRCVSMIRPGRLASSSLSTTTSALPALSSTPWLAVCSTRAARRGSRELYWPERCGAANRRGTAVVEVFFRRGEREAHVDLLPAIDNLRASYDRVLDPEKRQQMVPMGGDVTCYCILHLALHHLAGQLSGLLRILKLSRQDMLLPARPAGGIGS